MEAINPGTKFYRLSVIAEIDRKNGKRHFRCACECGTLRDVALSNLKNGHTRSCGCYRNERVNEVCATHGMTHTKEYCSWRKMRERTTDVNCPRFETYGAIGIGMQESWHNFQAFFDYMGPMPKDSKKYTIDRLDNTIGYQEGNVRWATNEQQARNKRAQKNNSSGVCGVSWHNKVRNEKELLYATAIWFLLDGTKTSKCFSVKTFGLLPAFNLAVIHRKRMIQNLNDQGANYSDKHGL